MKLALVTCMSSPVTSKRSLLLIDNDPAHAAVFREALVNASDGPFVGEWFRTLAESLERLKTNNFWAIFANLALPDSAGLETFNRLLSAASGTPILVLGGAADESLGLEALRRGAKDYILENHLEVYALVRAIRNMAERKTAEEALFNEQERAQVTLNSIGDAVLSTDIDGNVTYLNVVAEKLTGWTQEEAIGKRATEVFVLIDGSTRGLCPNPLTTAIEKNKTVGLTPHCILVRRDG